MKKQYLTKAERLQFVLSEDLKSILIGLSLGDLYVNKQKRSVNARLEFEQGLVHDKYLDHLYDLFQSYCMQVPKVYTRLPDKRTGQTYSRISFQTAALPCFNELYNLFYPNGQKVVPSNIGDLLTPLGLCYWICDDGGFCKRDKAITLSTQGFKLEEVELLISALTNKFDIKCTLKKERNAFAIRISSKSLPVVQNLLAPIIPSMMKHKIGL
jgi:hypothetical protein